MTLTADFATGTFGVVDTGVNNTSGKLPPVPTTAAVGLPPVSMTSTANN
jgi:hypothetical protein